MRFVVELKYSRGVSDQKPVVGYLCDVESKTQIDHDTGGPLVVTGVHGVEGIPDADHSPFYETRAQARMALRSMPGEFFDMYESEIVQID